MKYRGYTIVPHTFNSLWSIYPINAQLTDYPISTVASLNLAHATIDNWLEGSVR